MGHIFTYNDAVKYENWLLNPSNQEKVDVEHQLMKRMLHPMPGESVLDVGCGCGAGLMSLLDMGLQVTGADPSAHMIEFAAKRLKNRVDLHRTAAEELPFEDNAFTYSVISNTLEFTEEPRKALEEVFRVTKDRVFIGISNRHSTRAAVLRTQRIFVKNIYSSARFFSIWEMKKMIRSLAGDVNVSWRTLYRPPNPLGWLPRKKRRLNLVCLSPVGPYTGISVCLTPRYTLRVLRLKCPASPLAGTIGGMARSRSEAA